jgi:hypothetical protein
MDPKNTKLSLKESFGEGEVAKLILALETCKYRLAGRLRTHWGIDLRSSEAKLRNCCGEVPAMLCHTDQGLHMRHDELLAVVVKCLQDIVMEMKRNEGVSAGQPLIEAAGGPQKSEELKTDPLRLPTWKMGQLQTRFTVLWGLRF